MVLIVHYSLFTLCTLLWLFYFYMASLSSDIVDQQWKHTWIWVHVFILILCVLYDYYINFFSIANLLLRHTNTSEKHILLTVIAAPIKHHHHFCGEHLQKRQFVMAISICRKGKDDARFGYRRCAIRECEGSQQQYALLCSFFDHRQSSFPFLSFLSCEPSKCGEWHNQGCAVIDQAIAASARQIIHDQVDYARHWIDLGEAKPTGVLS